MNQDLAFKVSAQTQGEQALADFAKRLDGIEKSAGKMTFGLGKVTNLVKGFVAAFTFKEAVEFGKTLIDMADHLNDLSEKTGIGTNALSGFQEAAKKSGLSTEGLEVGLRQFSKSVIEAREGSVQMAAAFKNLGVSAAEVKKLSPEQLIGALADNFTKLKDGPEKAANALKLFGKSGTDLIPFLNQGSKSLSEFSLGIDEDFAKRADKFNDTISAIGSQLKKVFISEMKNLLPVLQDVANAFLKFPKMLSDSKSGFSGLGEVIRQSAYIFNNLATAAVDTADAVVTSFRAVREWGRWGKKGSSDNAEQMLVEFNIRSQARQKYLDASNAKILNPSAPQEPGVTTNTKSTPSTQGLGADTDKVQKFIELKKQENEQLKQSLGDYQLTAVELKKVQEARKLDKEVLKESLSLTAEQKEKLMAATEEIKKQRLALIEQEHQQQRTFGYGAKKAFDAYVENASNAAKNAQEFFNTAFKGMEDGLLEFVKSGTLNFQKFADAIIDEILRITIRQQVLAPLVGAIGGAFSGAATGTGSGYGGGFESGGTTYYSANGNIMTKDGPLPLKKYGRGGIATSPQVSIFGEGSRPEAYVPLPDGRRIPVAMQGNNANGSNVVVNVNMTSGEVDAQSSEMRGKNIGVMLGNIVKNELLKQQRPGGILAG